MFAMSSRFWPHELVAKVHDYFATFFLTSTIGYSTDQGRLLEGLTDAFYEITRGYKVTLCKTQASRLFV